MGPPVIPLVLNVDHTLKKGLGEETSVTSSPR